MVLVADDDRTCPTEDELNAGRYRGGVVVCAGVARRAPGNGPDSLRPGSGSSRSCSADDVSDRPVSPIQCVGEVEVIGPGLEPVGRYGASAVRVRTHLD